MQTVYRYIKENPSRFFFYSKIVNSTIFLLLFWVSGASSSDLLFKILLISFIVSVFTAAFWGTIYTNRPFEQNAAKVLLLLDIPIIFLLVYPLMSQTYFYLTLPLLTLITFSLLFEGRSLQHLLIAFYGLFVASSVVFSLAGLIETPFANFLAQTILFLMVMGSVMTTTRTIQEVEIQKKGLQDSRTQLYTKAQTLERQLKVSRQQAEVLNKDVRKRDMEIQNILNLSGQLKVKNDAREVLMSFLLTAVGQIGSEHAVLMTRVKKDNHFLNVYLHKGLRTIDINKIRFYLDSNLIEILNAIREPVLVSQIPKEHLYVDELKILQIFEKDLICPVFVKGNLSALYLIGSKITGQRFGKDDLSLMAIIANQTSFVLEQTQMTHDYREFYSKTMKAMLNSLETRYVYSRGHNMRTANYVNILSKQMGLSTREVSDFSSGALLHDLGKVVVSDKYLLNDAKFSDKNFVLKEKILEHAVEGSKILKAAGFNDTIVDMALHHHEFYNGKGYPHKVGKDELSLGTKILSVCNSYDAMTSARPYRKALPGSVAQENLRMFAGEQFDPEIVKIFLNELNTNPAMQKFQR